MRAAFEAGRLSSDWRRLCEIDVSSGMPRYAEEVGKDAPSICCCVDVAVNAEVGKSLQLSAMGELDEVADVADESESIRSRDGKLSTDAVSGDDDDEEIEDALDDAYRLKAPSGACWLTA